MNDNELLLDIVRQLTEARNGTEFTKYICTSGMFSEDEIRNRLKYEYKVDLS